MRGRPTDAELAILRVLWSRGPSTVREVMEALSSERHTTYTTVLKTMQIMHDKGQVHRDTSQRSHVYTPVQPAEQVQGSLVGDLVDRAFGGSTSDLVLRALTERPATKEELDEIRALLDALEE